MANPTVRLLIAAIALAFSPLAAAQDAPPAAAQADERLFAVLLEPGPEWKPGRPFAEQGLLDHFHYWMALHRQGRLVTAGPLGEDSGLVLLYAADLQEAETILNGDPAITERKFTGSVRPYTPPMVNAARLAEGQDG